jgi:hypothetical protein
MIVGVHGDRHSGSVLPDTNQESQPLTTKPWISRVFVLNIYMSAEIYSPGYGANLSGYVGF